MKPNKLYSSFSQMKGLLYSDWFDAILDEDFKPPIGVGIDVTNRCNLNCEWCNARDYRDNQTLPLEHVKQIIDMCEDWGVKTVCYAGGGEPTLHPQFPEILEYTHDAGLGIIVVTNATMLDSRMIDAIVRNAQICSASIDAGTAKTWQSIKKCDLFPKVIDGCRHLADRARNTGLDLTYKVLLSDKNQYELYTACKLAKDIGFKNFFVRPVASENILGECRVIDFDTEAVFNQLEQCRTLETDTFGVYSNFSRVSPTMFQKTHKFEKCQASPLFTVFCADGYCYLCIDYRSREEGRMCKHLDITEYWNSPAHHSLIDAVDLGNCPRCAFGNYNEQIEHYAADTFFRWFP